MSEAFIDLVRGMHLLALALGMGAALYLDWRTLQGLGKRIDKQDIVEIHRIHRFVTIAFAALWASGLYLVYIRTGFDLVAFTPKLWCKLMIVSAMSVNAWVIGAKVVPYLSARVGKRIVQFPLKQLMGFSTVAGISMFCWISALALGSSKVLKTAGWDILLSGLGVALAGIILGGACGIVMCRIVLVGLAGRPEPFDRVADGVSRPGQFVRRRIPWRKALTPD